MRASLVRAFAVPIGPAAGGADPPGTLVLVVPLTQSDQLDEGAFSAFAESVTIAWEGAGAAPWPTPPRPTDRPSTPSGPLRLRPDPRGWLLQPSEMEDAPPWRIVAQSVRPGGYLTLWPPAGDSLGFRIVNVEPLG